MTPTSSKRVQRVERELFEALSRYLLHGLAEELPCFASVTAVEVTPNLRHGKVFFRLVGESASTSAAEKILLAERSGFQREAAAILRDSKFTPVLKFEFGTVPHLDEVDQLFENLHRRRLYPED